MRVPQASHKSAHIVRLTALHVERTKLMFPAYEHNVVVTILVSGCYFLHLRVSLLILSAHFYYDA